MAWLPTPQGVVPAEAQASFHVSGDSPNPALYPHAPNPNETIQNIVGAITNVMQQKQKDDQANAILTQLKGSPQTGGEDALKQLITLQKIQQSQKDDALQNMLTQARTSNFNREHTDPANGKVYNQDAGGFVSAMDNYKIKHPNVSPTGSLANTPEFLDYKEQNKAYQDRVNQINNDAVDKFGVPAADVANIDKTPGAVKYRAIQDAVDSAKAPIIHTLPPGVAPVAGTTQGPILAGEDISTEDAQRLMKLMGPGSVMAAGTTPDGKAFDVPFSDYSRIHNQSMNMPQKPVFTPPPTASGAQPAAQPASSGNGPAVGTKGVVGGVPAVWNGNAWIQANA